MTAKIKNRAMLPVYVHGLSTRKYTLRQAAESTGYSIPYLCTLKKAYLEKGQTVFENKNKGRIPVNKIPDSQRAKIAALYIGEYKDTNFSYFQECLKEFESLTMSYVTLTSILKEYGQESPEAHHRRKKKPVHRPRVRRECEGDLIQIDGTPYAWFYKFGDNKRYCLVGGIDDATGKITGLYMTEFECLYGYLEMLRQTAYRFGIPREIYSDRAAIFCVTPRNKNLSKWEVIQELHKTKTQWQRILEELNVRQILAWSPEAKGRVERMWRTLQGQLPQWFYNRGIKTIEDANKNLSEYISWFNSKYGSEPAVDDSFWLDAPANLDDILCAKFTKRVSSHGIINFQSTDFYSPDIDLAYVDVEVCLSERGLFMLYKGTYYSLVPVGKKIQTTVSKEMPQVVQNIIHRYLFAFAKEVSA